MLLQRHRFSHYLIDKRKIGVSSEGPSSVGRRIARNFDFSFTVSGSEGTYTFRLLLNALPTLATFNRVTAYLLGLSLRNYTDRLITHTDCKFGYCHIHHPFLETANPYLLWNERWRHVSHHREPKSTNKNNCLSIAFTGMFKSVPSLPIATHNRTFASMNKITLV